jgi:uncharacterized HAD superfamily protein
LVTRRLEKYRGQTEAWLQKQQISYGELIMLDLPSKAERLRSAAHSRFKGEIFKRLDALLFIESDSRQAPEIRQISGKHVLCLETQELLAPDPLSPAAVAQKIRTLPMRFRHSHRNKIDLVKDISRQILGQQIYSSLRRLVRR